MKVRILLALAASLYGQAGFSSQKDNYPFSIGSEKTSNGHQLVARNAGPAPVSVKVSLVDSQYIKTDRQFPIYVVVPPGGTLYLGAIRAAISGVGYTFRTQYTWTLGDLNAVQAPNAMYRLPYRDGTMFRIGQSPGGPISTHTSTDSQFAVDIPMPEGTPVLAAREGRVIFTEANQVYGAKVPDMKDKANEVRILHIDGTAAIYAHLAHGGVHVYPGQYVTAGQQIGLAGSTGYSSGPHLHFVVQAVRKIGDTLETVSLPFQFYVGNPPVAFSPQFGMLAKADYSVPGVIPEMEPRTQIVRGPSQPSPQWPLATGVNVTIDPAVLNWFEKLKIKADVIGYAWFGIIGLLVLYLMQKSRRAIDRRRKAIEIREPMLRDFH